MPLHTEIQPYIDGNNLVAPAIVTPGTLSASDNGTLFTSEYYVMLYKLGQLIDQDKIDFASRIGKCISYNMLNRVPVGQKDGQEGPDDYYGVLNACMQLKNTDIPRRFLEALWLNKGSLDNVSPGKWQWDAVLIRQPQLLCAMISAAFPNWTNPFHVLLRAFCLPLYALTAIIIATSCMWTDPLEADPRRLSWHLMQTVKPVSLMCWLASKVWLWRLYRTYGPAGMQAVASLYYQKDTPLQSIGLPNNR